MPISNSEKQARHRQKEALKKFTEQTFREWQTMALVKRHSPGEVLALLEKAAELPSGWTEEDLENAQHRLGQLRLDLVTTNHDVQNDVYEALFSTEEFKRTPRPAGFVEDARRSVAETHALADHLISALKLSKLKDAEKAAAVAEAVRHVGRELSVSPHIHQSKATAMCLASMPMFYRRPEWFLDAFAKWLEYQLGEDGARSFGKHLVEFEYGALPWEK